MRYSNESKNKMNGVVYTPKEMADFLCDEMIRHSPIKIKASSDIAVLDPAIGTGELITSLIMKINEISSNIHIRVVGYETDTCVALETEAKLKAIFPSADITIYSQDFLAAAESSSDKFQFVIANPPYVRTQILGANLAQKISKKLNLTGRVDIYYAFLLNIKNVIATNGVAGYIISNKFFTIKSGMSVRKYMMDNYHIHSITDFGDTKLFSASVLPCTVVFSLGKTTNEDKVSFNSIYEDKSAEVALSCESIFSHIGDVGIYQVRNGKQFKFQHGILKNDGKDALWILSSDEKQEWLDKIDANTWLHFSDLGKIKVGIKTTADNVFIGNDWTGDKADLEWLRPLITHRDAGQIIAGSKKGWKVLYTHTIKHGEKTALDIEQYPKTKAYLEKYYDQLSSRQYIQKANRNWYEIWVPQDPGAWEKRKIVFRDISEQPEFWLDETGAIVNGDCYWIDINDSILESTLYLALAVANSKFIEKYYDAKFNTKLYSGKRRYMSQYVEQFPIPFANTDYARKAIDIVKKIIAGSTKLSVSIYMNELDEIVNEMFIAN